jgi:processive 1,2-diacylglycerol beta-glucosyltransferase
MKHVSSMKERFFLVMSASGGAGHTRAGEALRNIAPFCSSPIRVEHYDCLDFTSSFFKKLYSESYLEMVNHAPELWGYFYGKSEAKAYRKKKLLEVFDYFNYRQYFKFLQAANADAIICTHFLPFISISNEILRSGIRTPFFAATTDFDVHQYWVDPIIERYYVFHNESAWQIRAKGADEKRIRVKGIPLMPEFMRRKTAGAIRKELGIDPKDFTILILSGGFGIGPVERIVREVTKSLESFSSRRFNLLIVCGKNDKLRGSVEHMPAPINIQRRVFGFVDNVHDLMDASDVLISKAGGLTSAEAMAKGVPLLIVDPIPGQESRNADIIVEAGAGWKALDHHNLRYKLERIITEPTHLTNARKATKALAKPTAALDILEDVASFVQN